MIDYIVEIKTECIKKIKVRTTVTAGQVMHNMHKQIALHPGLGLVEPDIKTTSVDIRCARENEDAPYLDAVPTSSISDYMPPVKLGDTVYYIDTLFEQPHPGQLEVSAIHISKDDMRSHIVARPKLFKSISKNLPFHKFNKTWFIDKEKAMEALKEK